MNEAVSPAVTVTVRVVEFELEAFMTVRLTVRAPAVVKTWLGLRTVEVVPSPKLHCQIDGLPVDVSVNWTAWPAVGEAGVNVKDADRAAATAIVRVALVEPEALVMVRVTVLDPPVV